MGATAVRILVAELPPGEEPRILEEASRAVLLGKDAFTGGRLGASTIEATLRALEGFRRVLRNVEHADQAARIEYGPKTFFHIGDCYRRLARPMEAATSPSAWHRIASETDTRSTTAPTRPYSVPKTSFTATNSSARRAWWSVRASACAASARAGASPSFTTWPRCRCSRPS